MSSNWDRWRTESREAKRRRGVWIEREGSEMAAAASQKLLELSTKIVAVGRNYAAHAKELGNAVPKVPSLIHKSSFQCFIII